MADILKAIEKANIERLNKLITQENVNKIIDESSTEKYKALTYACSKGNLKVVTALVEQHKANIDSKDGSIYTPLDRAILAGKFDIVKYLVDKKADVNKQSKSKATAVYVAVSKDRLDILEYLVSKEADLHFVSPKGNLIWHAADNLATKCLDYLIKKKVEVNYVSLQLEQSVFFRVVLKYINCKEEDGRKKLMFFLQKLQKAGADINYIATRLNRKEAPLHLAARGTNIDMINELLKMKAKVNLQNDNGDTPLHVLFYRDGENKRPGSRKMVPFECIDAFLKNEANPNMGNKSGISPFIYMMKTYIWNSENDFKVVELFIKYKAKLNAKGFGGDTPLHYVARRSSREICEVLITNNADMNALNDSGETPLHSSTQLARFKPSFKDRSYDTYKKYATAYLLLQKGAKILKNEDGEFPHFLSNKNSLHDFNVMVEFKCNINAQANNGDTILHALAKRSKEDLHQVLDGNTTGKTFDLSIKNKEGKTIFDVVKNEGWKEVEEALKKIDTASDSKTNNTKTPAKEIKSSSKTETSKSSSSKSSKSSSTSSKPSNSKSGESSSKTVTSKSTPKQSGESNSKTVTSKTSKSTESKKSETTNNNNNKQSKPSSQKPESKTVATAPVKTTGRATNDKYDVMVSYQWDHQETALKIRDFLQDKGLKVWIDVEQMSGNILEKMAKAVIGSRVVVMCLSTKYEASDNCQKEYEYTSKKKRPFVPVKVENDFEPEEGKSLDFILGMALYYEVEKKKEFDINMPKVVTEIQKILKNDN